MKYIENRLSDYLFKKERQNLKEQSTQGQHTRTEIINFIADWLKKQKSAEDLKYLEIGVRILEDNFNHIDVKNKYSVDPGFENKENPVDFKMTSDQFFDALDKGEILDKDIKFDMIFIDGLHLADQVKRDIDNCLRYVNSQGFIVLHDCNPPEASYARENYGEHKNIAGGAWNGTTWKAFVEYRSNGRFSSCCIDSDFGVGVISTDLNLGPNNNVSNPFFEYEIFAANRKASLNLMSFQEFKKLMN